MQKEHMSRTWEVISDTFAIRNSFVKQKWVIPKSESSQSQ
jgi:hypothetical protein